MKCEQVYFLLFQTQIATSFIDLLSSVMKMGELPYKKIFMDNISVFNASYVYFFFVLSFVIVLPSSSPSDTGPTRLSLKASKALLYWNIFVEVKIILTLKLPIHC